MKLIAVFLGLFFVTGNARASVKTCQTAPEIKAHVETQAPEEFCFHKVIDPTITLASHYPIPAESQLPPNLYVAFLNIAKDFEGAQSACASLGRGWHAPESNKYGSYPRSHSRNSLEAVFFYFHADIQGLVWSSSTITTDHTMAWYSSFIFGITDGTYKEFARKVVCVRP